MFLDRRTCHNFERNTFLLPKKVRLMGEGSWKVKDLRGETIFRCPDRCLRALAQLSQNLIPPFFQGFPDDSWAIPPWCIAFDFFFCFIPIGHGS